MNELDCPRFNHPMIRAFDASLTDLTDGILEQIETDPPSHRSRVLHQILSDLNSSHARLVERLLRLMRDESIEAETERRVDTQSPVPRSSASTEKRQQSTCTEVHQAKRLRPSMPADTTGENTATVSATEELRHLKPMMHTHVRSLAVESMPPATPGSATTADKIVCRQLKLSTRT